LRFKPSYAPGPTAVRENVRLALAKKTNNTDFDKEFIHYYHEVCQKMGQVKKLINDILILDLKGNILSFKDESPKESYKNLSIYKK
jgi:aspartate aminotransferase-like enzyme